MTNRIDSIWQKIEKRGPDECWPWLGFQSWNQRGYGGYGLVDILGVPGVYAHRVAYLAANPGSISLAAKDGQFVLHKCDNPICCNPAHLYVGSYSDNTRDKIVRGRLPDYSGDRGPRCKLTMDQAREIRSLRKQGISARELAVRYGISLPSIKTLLRGKSYKED